MVVSSNRFLSKVLDDSTDWTARPYSALKGGLPSLFTSLESIYVSRYRDTPWSKEELSFVACAFPSHLQVRFQDEYETQTYNPHRFARQFGFDQGILGHLSTLALSTVVASLAFKRENLIKILVLSPKISFTSPTRTRLPSPRFKLWWSDIREHVRNFRESGAQRVDVPPIFQGDLTLKLLPKAKPSVTKRKKNAKTPSSKKPKVHLLLYSD